MYSNRRIWPFTVPENATAAANGGVANCPTKYDPATEAVTKVSSACEAVSGLARVNPGVITPAGLALTIVGSSTPFGSPVTLA